MIEEFFQQEVKIAIQEANEVSALAPQDKLLPSLTFSS
jgi:hypothetical protein